MKSNNLRLPPPVNVPATPAIESRDINSIYDLSDATLLGKGGFSEVVAVRHIATGELRALKIMERKILVGKKAEMVAHEREILRRANHPNIVKLHEVIQTPDRVYMALDLMREDLFEYIIRNKRVGEEETRQIMHQVLSAIAYLHEQSIVHRDIKPENILFNDPTDVKLADFGLAKLVQEWDVRSTPCGTSFYIAPEVIRGIESQGAEPLCTTQRLVKSVDIWSAGVVMFVLMSARPPFHGQVKTSDERRHLLHRIDRGVLFMAQHGWDTVSDEAKDLIARMLEQNNDLRLTAQEALRHPFFTEHGMKPIVALPIPVGGIPQSAPHPVVQASTHGESSDSVDAMKDAAAKGEGADGDDGHVKKKKKSGLLSGVKNFFMCGPNGVKRHQPTAEEAERMKAMQAELNAIQEEIIETGDAEGDKTCYTVDRKESRPSRPAVMNTKAKIGPGALKK